MLTFQIFDELQHAMQLCFRGSESFLLLPSIHLNTDLYFSVCLFVYSTSAHALLVLAVWLLPFSFGMCFLFWSIFFCIICTLNLQVNFYGNKSVFLSFSFTHSGSRFWICYLLFWLLLLLNLSVHFIDCAFFNEWIRPHVGCVALIFTHIQMHSHYLVIEYKMPKKIDKKYSTSTLFHFNRSHYAFSFYVLLFSLFVRIFLLSYTLVVLLLPLSCIWICDSLSFNATLSIQKQ